MLAPTPRLRSNKQTHRAQSPPFAPAMRMSRIAVVPLVAPVAGSSGAHTVGRGRGLAVAASFNPTEARRRAAVATRCRARGMRCVGAPPRPWRDEQLLGDLTIGVAASRQPRHSFFAGGQRLHAHQRGGAWSPAGRVQPDARVIEKAARSPWRARVAPASRARSRRLRAGRPLRRGASVSRALAEPAPRRPQRPTGAPARDPRQRRRRARARVGPRRGCPARAARAPLERRSIRRAGADSRRRATTR